MKKRIPLKEVAYHEAGHAIGAIAAGKALGLNMAERLQETWIAPVETTEGPGGMFGWSAPVDPSMSITKLDKHELAMQAIGVSWMIVISMCGAAAQAKLTGRHVDNELFNGGGGHDLIDAVKNSTSLVAIMERLGGKPAGDTKTNAVYATKEFLKEAQELVSKQWAAVTVLGEALLQARRLSGPVIEAIVKPAWVD